MNKGITRAELREPKPYPIKGVDKLKNAVREQIVQGMNMDRKTVAAIVGPPGVGKSVLAIDLGMKLVAGKEFWLGRKIKPGAICYFAAEAPGSVTMRAKVAAERAKCTGDLFFICKAAPGLGGKDTSEEHANRIIATIRNLNRKIGVDGPIVMAFIDTVAATMGDGNENAEGMVLHMQAARRIAEATGVCVVLIHHPNKNDPFSERGHGSLRGTCEAIIHVNIEEQTGVRIATLTKARDDQEGLQLRFELERVKIGLDSWGDPQTTVVVKLATLGKPRQLPKGKNPPVLLRALERKGDITWTDAAIRKMAEDELKMQHTSAHKALEVLIAGGYFTAESSPLHRVLKDLPVKIGAK
jgi:hypothetical protein